MTDQETVNRLRGHLHLCEDALRRAGDGVDSFSWGYVLDQLGKLSVNVAEAQWRVDTLQMLVDKDSLAPLAPLEEKNR